MAHALVECLVAAKDISELCQAQSRSREKYPPLVQKGGEAA
jgi:hypothetical protein